MDNGEVSGIKRDADGNVGGKYKFIESLGGSGSYIRIGSVSLLMNGASGTFSLKSDKMICRRIARGGVLYLKRSQEIY